MSTWTTGPHISKEPLAERLPQYPILDALRFVLALWVAIGHYGVFSLFTWVDASTSLGRFVTHAWNTVVFGTPAVIVFFVISGFCIHLPFRGQRKLEVGRYYLRRYTRILIPVAGALCVYRLGGQHMRLVGEHSILWESPLWSLLCEEIYYAACPGLRWLRHRFGWRSVLAIAFLASVGVAAINVHTTNVHTLTWHTFGPFGTALILLPVWLLGCVLAEQSEGLQAESRPCRSGAGAFWRGSDADRRDSALQSARALYANDDVVWNPGVLVGAEGNCVWKDADSESLSGGRRCVELFAVPGAPRRSSAVRQAADSEPGHVLMWFGAMGSSLLISYVFYLLIERPSHRLARKVRPSKATAVPRYEDQEIRAVVAPEI